MSGEGTSRRSQTEWARVDALADADIDFSDVPEVTAELFARAVVRKGLKPVTTSPLGASGEPVIKPR